MSAMRVVALMSTAQSQLITARLPLVPSLAFKRWKHWPGDLDDVLLSITVDNEKKGGETAIRIVNQSRQAMGFPQRSRSRDRYLSGFTRRDRSAGYVQADRRHQVVAVERLQIEHLVVYETNIRGGKLADF